MSPKIDPTGFSTDVWNIALDYTSPTPQEAVIYEVHHLPSTNHRPEYLVLCYFNYAHLAKTLIDYSAFGQYYGLTKVDEQIRAFASKTFVINEKGRPTGREMNLCAHVIGAMNTPARLDLVPGEDLIPDLLHFFQQLGLVAERALDHDRKQFFSTLSDQPKELVTVPKRFFCKNPTHCLCSAESARPAEQIQNTNI